MIMIGLAPVFCYIPEGPYKGTANDTALWSTLMSAPDDDEGVISRGFSYEGSSATILNENVVDVGPTTGFYDPEWDSFIAGELN